MTTVGYQAQPATAHNPALFGRVMGLVALTVGFATLGVAIAYNWGGAGWFIAWIASLGCLIGLNAASGRGNHVAALGLLFAFGLLIGISVAGTIHYYAATQPTAVRQAFGATTLFVGALGAGGYAVRRDLSPLYRLAFWLLLALMLGSMVVIIFRIPSVYTMWTIAGLAIFGLYVVLDFNRLRHAGREEAIPLAAGIFLDVLNVFLLFLRLFSSR
jgi:modulator of FtsH protease